MMFLNCLAVGAGGFVGSVCRYLIGLIPVLHKGALPYQTLLVNVAGAALIGMIVKYAQLHGAGDSAQLSPQMILFLKVGICGGFTTFSTFSLESAEMIQSGNQGMMLVYAVVSVCLCLGGVFLGEWLMTLAD